MEIGARAVFLSDVYSHESTGELQHTGEESFILALHEARAMLVDSPPNTELRLKWAQVWWSRKVRPSANNG